MLARGSSRRLKCPTPMFPAARAKGGARKHVLVQRSGRHPRRRPQQSCRGDFGLTGSGRGGNTHQAAGSGMLRAKMSVRRRYHCCCHCPGNISLTLLWHAQWMLTLTLFAGLPRRQLAHTWPGERDLHLRQDLTTLLLDSTHATARSASQLTGLTQTSGRKQTDPATAQADTHQLFAGQCSHEHTPAWELKRSTVAVMARRPQRSTTGSARAPAKSLS